MDRLAEYQKLLIARGIINREHLKMLVAQLLTENGAMDENALGDWECHDKKRGTLKNAHCSFGILQLNTWSRYGMSAEKYLQLHPEWKAYTYQLAAMADSAKASYDSYKGSIFRTVVSHNCPSCARASTDACFIKKVRQKRCYYQRVSDNAWQFTSL